ncbi:methyltransferase domain-containing protein [Mesorhizobium caraganae]|uniref:methyltransferase domain-containing protein n=1 Tax=Mesorhizobium caraganae TaxID=483206 RepID=UPI00193A6672|nr:methyltransferase domain-containing protein [Mesorhizobium caraganae]MBM2711149.1 methyltransferase domain-containing protein [Mesorhizobium caraganae]
MTEIYADETVEFWLERSHSELAHVAAALHRDRRQVGDKAGLHEVIGARTVISDAFVKGIGIEVGAGNRPFPVPPTATVIYGDIRDNETLKTHFADKNITEGGFIDAETFAGTRHASLDFVISAHVIEHLANPFGSIREGLARLKPGGVYVIAVPDMRFTTDRDRPPTPFDHLMDDLSTGGEPTLLASYIEHCRYVHPISQPAFTETELVSAAEAGLKKRVDIHVHAWTKETFSAHLDRLAEPFGFTKCFESAIRNEALFVLQKNVK